MVKVDTEKLRKLRNAIPLTQPELAERMGLKRSTYAYKEKIGEFTEREIQDLIRIIQVERDELVDCGNTSPPATGNGNDKERLISALQKQVDLLEKEVRRLQDELQVSSVDLREFGIANNAHLKTLLECFAKHRSVTEKVALDKVFEDHDKVLAAKTREILKTGRT